uniref:Phytocyanin domain-containing protein n=1 Tax=Cannabis sativa TaxID=3483 RepID=A0A803Q9Q4_CANSA
MARGLVGLICCFALTVVIFTDSTAAVTHTVGDTTGWTIPSSPEFYTDTWEDNKTFRIGDKLAFNWSGVHNVAQVSTEADYDNCNTAAARVLSSTSPFEFTLNTTGDHYFLCTVGTHCRSGQKLKLEENGEREATCEFHVDRALNDNGAGAGVVMTALGGTKMYYAISFGFKASNNEAEYEAMLVGLKLAKELEVMRL